MYTHTVSEENYLKAIYKLSKGNSQPVSTNKIAELLKTTPASVSDMLKKLSAKELLLYAKYRGVNLTDEGLSIALQLVRRHRLWEVFLVQKLKFNWDEVHEVAEELEHVNSRLLIQRLDQFLGFPQQDPHGDPIPAEDGSIRQLEARPLSVVLINTMGVVTGLRSTQPLFLQYLDKLGIYIGAKVKVKDKIEYDNSLELTIDNQNNILISRDVASNILIS